MYNTILVPVDMAHTDKAEAMFDIARKLGKKDAKVVVVNIVEEIPTYILSELPRDMMANSVSNAKKSLEELAKSSGLNATVHVEVGHPATSILEVAKKDGADCIIVASHRPGFQDYLLGSTAARVVRHARCAVHVMR